LASCTHHYVVCACCCTAGEHTGITEHAASLAFVWSQPLVVDDLMLHRQRASGLDFLDFCEALARIADMASLPPLNNVLSLLSALSEPDGLTAEAEQQPYHVLIRTVR
jgi:hypothetical protein